MTGIEKPGLRPVLITVIGVGLLMALGTWQLSRMTEKNTLLQRIDARSALAMIMLPSGAIDPEGWQYRKVNVTGTFLHDQEIHLFAIGPGGLPGFQVITPLLREDGLPVFINRGWVPEGLKDPDSRISGQVSGDMRIEGMVALGRAKSRFTPENDLSDNRWYYVDLEGMAVATGLGEHMPVIIDAVSAPHPGGYPALNPDDKATTRRPANNHLLYAITWYSLALGLTGVFLIYRRRLQA